MSRIKVIALIGIPTFICAYLTTKSIAQSLLAAVVMNVIFFGNIGV